MNIREKLKSCRLWFDGGMGTELQARGLAAGEQPERWNLTHPEAVVEVHTAYLLAGADILKTNTFGANELKLPNYEEVITAAIANARAACAACADMGKDFYIAFDIGPIGKMLAPFGDLSFEDAVSVFKRSFAVAVAAGVDLFLIETMGDSYETKAAVLAAKETADLPIFVTNAYDASGRILTGADPAAMVALLEGLSVDALGINCSLGPAAMKETVKKLLDAASIPVIVNPNAGLPRANEKGETVYDLSAADFASAMTELVEMGISVAGGCCGTTPAYIKAAREAAAEIPYRTPSKKHRTVVSSHACAVEFGKAPVLIGERINPTGKKRFKEALRASDIDFIVREGLAEEDAGAHILDVNVGLPEIDEVLMMTRVIEELQPLTRLPLQIDTSNACAMERALRRYNGKPLLNSVNGKRESMETVFPLAAKYGGVVVALTLDESGIPATAEGRLAIAERIVKTAARFGIEKENIIIDTLTMAVSADAESAVETLRALRLVKETLGVSTVLGVSNISFGLPERELLNATFFTMALEAGLDAAILNPFSARMMESALAFTALAGKDTNFASYIEAAPRFARTAPASSVGSTTSAAPAPAGSAGSVSPAVPTAPATTAVSPASAKSCENGAENVANGSQNKEKVMNGAAFSEKIQERAQSADDVPNGLQNKENIANGLQNKEKDADGLRDLSKAPLSAAIIKGLRESAYTIAKESLAVHAPMAVIHDEIIPALDAVGKGFEKRTVYLPQLLLAAEAAKAAFDAVAEAMEEGGAGKRGDRILLATVKGDIHDIGKNIVKVLLENYGFDVLDLGKDVPPEAIVEAVVREKIRLVGLSALMTTTVPAMAETIKLLRAAAPDTKIMVGGAVLTKDYADMIGADFYAPDVMHGVRYAEEIFGARGDAAGGPF